MSLSRQERMKQMIVEKFAPELVEVVDESALHAHHHPVTSGLIAAGETHYRVLVVSTCFADVSRVQRSRMVHDVLEGEFAKGLHALALIVRTPDEHKAIMVSGSGSFL